MKNCTITKRKAVLLAAAAALTVIYILQLVFSGGTDIKDFTLETPPDSFTMTRSGSALAVQLSSGSWTVSDKKYPADSALAETMVNSMKALRVLGTVSHSGDYERYGLSEIDALTVEASAQGKLLRTVQIGKKSPTSQHTYVRIDGSKEVYLLSGTIGDTFGKTTEELRSKQIYSLNSGDISKIEVTNSSGSFAVVKEGNPPAWTFASSDGTDVGSAASNAARQSDIDAEKAASWAGSITTLRAQSFEKDDLVLPPQSDSTVAITAAGQTVTVRVYPSSKENTILCSSSESPYPFLVSTYTGERYMKKKEDLSKK